MDSNSVMHYPLNLDSSIECVKQIVDTIRCAVCDKSDGSRLRYCCGHTACTDCVATSPECLFCLTPPNTTNTFQPIPDEPLTHRVKHASSLLNTCQDLLHIDVYRRQRLSEQLKIEKEIFPDCIQAPIKYTNKRKSSNVSFRNKENRKPYFYSGEEVASRQSKMEHSMNFVQQWLNEHEQKLSDKQFKRKPFVELNVNTPSPISRGKRTAITKRADTTFDDLDENTIFKKNRKRSRLKSALPPDTKYLKHTEKLDVLRPKKLKKKSDPSEKILTKSPIWNDSNSNKEESGIVIDDEPVIIDDSQSEIIDKDKLAWMAVLENNETNSTSNVEIQQNEILRHIGDVEETSQTIEQYNIKEANVYKVPFYKKGYLSENCKCCGDFYKNKLGINQKANQSDDVCITIESSSFITTVNVSNSAQSYSTISKEHANTAVQTDINTTLELREELHSTTLEAHDEILPLCNIRKDMKSQDVFSEKAKYYENHEKNDLSDTKIREEPANDNDLNIPTKKSKHVVIEDSDTDIDVQEESLSLQVTADVHRSSDQISESAVLAEVEQNECRKRKNRAVRRRTPASTDSSDKENRDPNRAKKMKSKKNRCTKKENIEFDVIQSLSQ